MHNYSQHKQGQPLSALGSTYYNTITLSEESGVSAVGNHLSILKDILQLANRHRSELQLQQLLSFLHLSS